MIDRSTYISKDIEFVIAIIEKFIYVLLYIPPQLPAKIQRELTEKIVNEVDGVLITYYDNYVIMLGDFNDFRWNNFTANFDIPNIVNFSTRNDSQLDLVLVVPTFQTTKKERSFG